MPRVTTHTKSGRATKRPYVCTGCREEIEAGQAYYKWAIAFQPVRYRHTKCGYPRPTELSSRKTAVVEEAIGDAYDAIDAVPVEVPGDAPRDEHGELDESFALDFVVDDLRMALEPVADSAEEIGQEYESSADNMPEALQYSEQAEAMRAVGQELQEWADDLRSWDPAVETEVDLTGIEDWDAEAATLIEDAADTIREEAKTALENMPEYQG